MNSIVKAFVVAMVSLTLAGCVTLRPPPELGAGDWVLARFEDDTTYYFPAIVTSRTGDQLSLQYDDGDVGVQPARNVRRFDWRVGTRFECRWTDGAWYPATITEMGSNRVDMHIRYDDGDRQATTTSQCRDR
jgi:hypothetical protein